MTIKQTVVVTSAAFLAIAALALGARQLYFMAAVMFALPMVAYVFCVVGAGGLDWEREATERAFEGDTVRVCLRIRNRGRLPRFFLWLSDAVPEWLSTNGSPEFVVQTLWPGDSVDATYEAVAEKRGVYALGPVSTLVTDPLGLFSIWRHHEVPGEMVIYPRPVPLSSADIMGSHALGLTDAQRLAAAGAGSDFYGIRDYRPGDERRRIHWKSTARLGRLAVVDYQQGSAEDVVIVLDLKQGTEFGHGRETTLEYAVKAAASLAAHSVEQGASAALVATSSEGPQWLRATDGEELYDIYEFLARAQADGDERVSGVMERAGNSIGPGTIVVILTSDLDPALLPQVARWSARRAAVCVLLLDAAAFSGKHRGVDNGAQAYAQALSDSGARVETIRPGDDLATTLRSLWHAARAS